MLRFALFYPPDEGPLLFKDHFCVNHRVVSQEWDYCIILYYYCDQPSSFSQAPSACGVQCSTKRLVILLSWILHSNLIRVQNPTCLTFYTEEGPLLMPNNVFFSKLLGIIPVLYSLKGLTSFSITAQLVKVRSTITIIDIGL